MTVTTFIEHLLCAGTLLGALHASSPFTNCPAAGRQVSGLAEVTQPVRGTAGIQTQVCVALKLKSSPHPLAMVPSPNSWAADTGVLVLAGPLICSAPPVTCFLRAPTSLAKRGGWKRHF